MVNLGIELIETNLAMTFETILTFILTIGSMIFSAKDFKLGLIILMTTMFTTFIWFYEAGLEWSKPLIIFFISLVILCLTIYSVNKTSQTGGFT